MTSRAPEHGFECAERAEGGNRDSRPNDGGRADAGAEGQGLAATSAYHEREHAAPRALLKGKRRVGLLPVGRGPRRLHAKLPCNRRLRFSPTAPHWARPSSAPFHVDAAPASADERTVRVRRAAQLAHAASVAVCGVHHGTAGGVGRQRLVRAGVNAYAAAALNPGDAAVPVDNGCSDAACARIDARDGAGGAHAPRSVRRSRKARGGSP